MKSLGKLGVALAAGFCLAGVSGAQPTRVSQDSSEAVVAADVADPQAETAVPQRVGSAPLRVGSPSPAVDFDARIRRVDRDGPDGATQLWVYNAGPATAVGCMIQARADSAAEFEQVASVAAIDARQTIKLPDMLPPDAGEFLVACPFEPEAAIANNGWVLDQED